MCSPLPAAGSAASPASRPACCRGSGYRDRSRADSQNPAPGHGCWLGSAHYHVHLHCRGQDVNSREAFAEWVSHLHEQGNPGVPLELGRVHADYWWVVEGAAYLGAVTLRHTLNDSLLQEGGHIGYGIRPSARRRGLATWALANGLIQARGPRPGSCAHHLLRQQHRFGCGDRDQWRPAALRRSAFGTTWRRATTRAGLAGLRFHDLRHYCASLLIRHGESVKTDQARLGHASAAETLDTYSHLWPDSDDRTREAVDLVLGDSADYLRTATP
ncbi:tyrosine-type recombinase/integrase [Oryzihumus leptocrescens]|uniref:tyrosine-type recombinase/integrase n=1 Tax=Oryzihumus leptocrescens TaxID=297536 RepID=UPI00319DAFA2